MGNVACFELLGIEAEKARAFLSLMIEGFIQGQKTPLMVTPALALQSIWKLTQSTLTPVIDGVLSSDWVVLLSERGQSEMCAEKLMAEAQPYSERIGEILG